MTGRRRTADPSCPRCRAGAPRLLVWFLLHWTCQGCGHRWVTH